MFTLTTTVNYINQALNYPSAVFDDLKLFFNQAISEINTNLHIGIKNIDTLITENRTKFNNMPNIVILPTGSSLYLISSADEPTDTSCLYYYNTTTKKFGKKVDSHFEYFDILYGVQNTGLEIKIFKTIMVSDIPTWIEDVFDNPYDLDLEIYFPNDWIILFIIPYICFKYSIRDGNPIEMFMQDASQGFQQLNSNYNVPECSQLIEMAGHPAYTEDVKKHMADLNIFVPTRAITEDMRVPRDIPFVGNEFYHNGGFGI